MNKAWVVECWFRGEWVPYSGLLESKKVARRIKPEMGSPLYKKGEYRIRLWVREESK